MAEPDAPFGGAVLLADASAWQRSHHPAIRDEWRAALAGGQIVTCSLIRLELLFSTRTAEEFERAEADHALLRDVPVTSSVQRAAVAAMRELARQGPLHHRVPIPDLLIAAAAQDAGTGVLHYDHHYDRLAEVLSFESRWLAEPGSL